MAKLPKIEGNVWIGSEVVHLDSLEDKAVLVDFWTYSCINCLRTLPYIKEWYKKYKDDGLVIIGIHSPEFEFEKDPSNVEKAIKQYSITWPVLLDNEHRNWENFNNQYWPTKYLADGKGHVMFTHQGEGGYAETERKIREALGLKNPTEIEKWENQDHFHDGFCGTPTAETYCGYLRGWVGNQLGYAEDKEELYTEEGAETSEGKIRLNGPFFAAGEYVESRATNANVSLSCRGTEINLVLSHSLGKDSVVEVLWNGEPLYEEIRGVDVNPDSSINVNRSGLFNLLKSKKETVGTIEIRAKHGNFRAHAFTFSGCVSNI